MLGVEVLPSLIALGIGILGATLMVLVWVRANRPSNVTARTLLQEAEDSIAFLFDDETLVDATPRARAFIKQGDNRRTDWENLLTLLSARFPHLRSQCKDLAIVGRKSILPRDDAPGVIEAEYWNGLARLTLIQDQESSEEPLDPLTTTAMEHELQTLRSIGEDSPQLIWKRDAEGVLIWANRAYFELSEAIYPIEEDALRPWPPREVFQDTAVPAGHAPIIGMHQVEVPGQDKPIWYEVTSVRRDTDTIHFAIDASAAVFARDAQRNFVQTLTKTFAQLSVGLAIFDADRRLVLFNPALKTLTELPADFLIARPTLFAFLDRLRDANMIPEPKDYGTWRDQMTALETAAQDGNYHETWALPTGQTYKVTGKPHPNGAIAFLMEDISDEVSLTRKFRSQIEINTAALNALPSGVAVFASSGPLLLSNASYNGVWGIGDDSLLSDRDLLEELDKWEAATAPSPYWHKLREILARGGSNGSWQGVVHFEGNTQMMFQYTALPDGNHMVAFSEVPSSEVIGEHLEDMEFSDELVASG